jgi:RimJ/RimL family protein N-acetyltransferase
MPHPRPILLDLPQRFVGQRVLMRPFVDDDTPAMHAAITESRAHLRPWMPWYDNHGSLNDTRDYIRTTMGNWILRTELSLGIFAHDTGAFLGGTGLHIQSWDIPAFEIGYWLRKSAEGHGYVTESTRLLTTFAFDGLAAQRVVIRCDARNSRSAAIPQRLGYVLEGTLRYDQIDPEGKPRDTLIFAMIREDYQRARVGWP